MKNYQLPLYVFLFLPFFHNLHQTYSQSLFCRLNFDNVQFGRDIKRRERERAREREGEIPRELFINKVWLKCLLNACLWRCLITFLNFLFYLILLYFRSTIFFFLFLSFNSPDPLYHFQVSTLVFDANFRRNRPKANWAADGHWCSLQMLMEVITTDVLSVHQGKIP